MNPCKRLVVRGMVIRNGRILLVQHEHYGRTAFWCFPGGGVEENETLKEALVREMLEETNIEVNVGLPVLVQEFVKEKTVEIVFSCEIVRGEGLLGIDPDNPGVPILKELGWFPIQELNYMTVYPEEYVRALVRGEGDYSTIPFGEVKGKVN